MRLRILGQKWARRAKRATTKQVQDRKDSKRNNKPSGVWQTGQQKVAGGNTRSICDNPSTEDDIILMRQLSGGCVPNRQIQKTKCRYVTCNRVSGKTKRVQRITQVV